MNLGEENLICSSYRKGLTNYPSICSILLHTKYLTVVQFLREHEAESYTFQLAEGKANFGVFIRGLHQTIG